MKLNEVAKEVKEKGKAPNESDGTYVGVRFTSQSKANVEKLLDELKVPNPVKGARIHATIVYSRKTMDESFTPAGKYKTPLKATVTGFKTFKTQEGHNALVLQLDCPEMVKRHKQLVKEYGATHDYDEYIPHITLSYNSEDFDSKNKEIPNYIKTLYIEEEYKQPLVLDWIKDKKT